MVLTLSVSKQLNFGIHYLKKLGKFNTSFNAFKLLSRDGMELAVNAICVNDFVSLEPFNLCLLMF